MYCDRKQISTTVIENNDEPLGLWEEQLLKRFQGDFDNYDQVLEDRQNGLLPREGGGHENIHCTLLPVSSAKDNGNNDNNNDSNLIGRVMAAFYLNGIPQQIFRLRLYTLYRHNNNNNINNNDNKCVRMVLATFEPTLERELKAMQFHQWSSFLQDQLYNTKNEGKKSWEDLMVPLENCDVRWTETPDPQQHAYAYNNINDPMDAYHAVMVSGPNGTIVPSQMDPNILINIRDELSLWENEFWINDRGLDPNDPSNFIYGNQRGIPYKLKRVTNIQKKNNNSQSRIIVNPQLGWTLGPDHRTELFYEQKMVATQKNYTSTTQKNYTST